MRRRSDQPPNHAMKPTPLAGSRRPAGAAYRERWTAKRMMTKRVSQILAMGLVMAMLDTGPFAQVSQSDLIDIGGISLRLGASQEDVLKQR
jgi:hypothetical protein